MIGHGFDSMQIATEKDTFLENLQYLHRMQISYEYFDTFDLHVDPRTNVIDQVFRNFKFQVGVINEFVGL